MRQTYQYINKELTLEQMLPRLSTKLYNGDLYALAITLVASVFQLIETPWLDKTWNEKGIVFIRAQTDGMANSADIRYPILMEEFLQSTPLTLPSGQRDRTILLALGIMLLEIACRTSIDVVRRPEDLGPSPTPNNETDHKTALRWLFELDQEGCLTSGFSRAITTCLQAYINPHASFSDPDFEYMIENTVLTPLEEEMEFLTA
jgi:hypothetical protein